MSGPKFPVEITTAEMVPSVTFSGRFALENDYTKKIKLLPGQMH
jgi:hypothetical protein